MTSVAPADQPRLVVGRFATTAHEVATCCSGRPADTIVEPGPELQVTGFEDDTFR
jgi:hypothetical protein